MIPKFIRDDLQKVFIEGVNSSSPSASKASNEKADSASRNSEEKSESLLESSKTATAISSGVAVIESDTKL